VPRIQPIPLDELAPKTRQIIEEGVADGTYATPACLVAQGGSELTEQERLAVQFLDLLSADHHAIDDEFYRELGHVFTAAQIIELGFTCASSMGLHRFIHTLDVFGTDEPVIAYDPSQVDAAFDGAAFEGEAERARA
jgi:hypothetical protein